jgi:hypothetical protein
VYLGLDHHLPAQFSGDGLHLRGSRGDLPFGKRNPGGLEEGAGLILVEIHEEITGRGVGTGPKLVEPIGE